MNVRELPSTLSSMMESTTQPLLTTINSKTTTPQSSIASELTTTIVDCNGCDVEWSVCDYMKKHNGRSVATLGKVFTLLRFYTSWMISLCK